MITIQQAYNYPHLTIQIERTNKETQEVTLVCPLWNNKIVVLPITYPLSKTPQEIIDIIKPTVQLLLSRKVVLD